VGKDEEEVMKLADAILCFECSWIFSTADHKTCPRCLNKYGLSLSRVLNLFREERQDKGNVVVLKTRRKA
jgi:uncharacterized paraquat-inducible protein A